MTTKTLLSAAAALWFACAHPKAQQCIIYEDAETILQKFPSKILDRNYYQRVFDNRNLLIIFIDSASCLHVSKDLDTSATLEGMFYSFLANPDNKNNFCQDPALANIVFITDSGKYPWQQQKTKEMTDSVMSTLSRLAKERNRDFDNEQEHLKFTFFPFGEVDINMIFENLR
jgi:hypothetical protein